MAEAYHDRGTAYGLKSDFDQAITDFTHAIRLSPDLPGAYLNRGKAYELKGSKDKAAADFAKAKALEAMSGGAHGHRRRRA